MENVRNGAKTINQIVAVGRNRTAIKKQQQREVARAEAFNVQRSVFGVWCLAGAVRTSVTLLVQYMGNTFVFGGLRSGVNRLIQRKARVCPSCHLYPLLALIPYSSHGARKFPPRTAF